MVQTVVPVKIMAEPKVYSPLKIGLLVVSIAYFLFTVHALFTLSWIGEWEVPGGGFSSFWILITDVSAYFGLIFRFIASFIAVVAIIFYFTKKDLPESIMSKVLRWIVVLEALYWVPLFLSGVMGFLPMDLSGLGVAELNLMSLITTGIPCLVSSIAIPIVLFKLVFKLKPNNPQSDAIKWGLIASTAYIFVFWLNNTGMWIVTVLVEGTGYLTTYPVTLLSFALTTMGLLALTVFTAYFTKKSAGTETLERLNLRTVGLIIIVLGLYFLWNYLTWIFFGGDYLWSDLWYAWFLGHNLDLWLLSLPLVGLPLLFKRHISET
jgi:hypothetical protein